MGFPAAAEKGGEAMGGGRKGEWREKWSASEVVVDVDGAKSEIKVERSCDPGWSAEDFADNVIQITDIGIVVVVIVVGVIGHRTDIGMPVYDVAFVRTLASSLRPSKPEEGQRAEWLEEALWYDAWLCVGR